MRTLSLVFSTSDESKASQLKQTLFKHNSAWYFKEEFSEQPDLFATINDQLRDSDFCICIISKNFLQSNPFLEDVFSLNDIEERLLFLFWDDFKSLKKLKPILQKNWGIDFTTNSDNEFDQKVEDLIKIIKEPESHTEIYSHILQPSPSNPFGAVKSEYIQKEILASIFQMPEHDFYNLLQGPRSVILFGGRGSGKTTILRSLELTTAIALTGKPNLKESDLKTFGIYLKIDRGGFVMSNKTEIDVLGESTSKLLFLDDFILQFVESLILTLIENIKNRNIILSDETLEQKVTNHIFKLLNNENSTATNLVDLLNWINVKKSHIRKFLGKKAFGIATQYDGVFTSLDTLKKICKAFREEIDDLHTVTFVFLLDEIENFLPYQQKITNTMLKLSDDILTFKIASKFEGLSTNETLLEQQIQPGHDYARLSLDYNISNPDKRKRYVKLLIGICEKLLRTHGCKETDIKKILKKDSKEDVSEEKIRLQLEEMLKKKGQNIDKFSEKEISEKINYYKTALIYRALNKDGKRRSKNFSGFETFVYLSSGITRYFLELCGMAFYLTNKEENIDIKEITEISAKTQSKAIFNESYALIEKLGLDIEEYGISMRNFILDIGDIFRTKLLYDNNEPETIRIGIEDSFDSWPKSLQELITTGIRESVFLKVEDPEIMRQKNTTSHRPVELLLNRMYCPALGISYAARWRTSFKAKELGDLIEQEHSKIKLKYINRIKKYSSKKREYVRLDKWG